MWVQGRPVVLAVCGRSGRTYYPCASFPSLFFAFSLSFPCCRGSGYINYCPHCFQSRGPAAVRARGGDVDWPHFNGERAENGNYIESEEVAQRHGICGDPEQVWWPKGRVCVWAKDVSRADLRHFAILQQITHKIFEASPRPQTGRPQILSIFLPPGAAQLYASHFFTCALRLVARNEEDAPTRVCRATNHSICEYLFQRCACPLR